MPPYNTNNRARHSPKHRPVGNNNGYNGNGGGGFNNRRSNSSNGSHRISSSPALGPAHGIHGMSALHLGAAAASSSTASPPAPAAIPLPTGANPPLGALLKHLPTPELAELEVAIRSILYVLSDNLCPIVKTLNDKRRMCVTDVKEMLIASTANSHDNITLSANTSTISELYGSGRTGLTACTSSDLDFVVVMECPPTAVVHPLEGKNDGMSAFYRAPHRNGATTANGGDDKKKAFAALLSGTKRSRDKDDESLFFEDGFDSEQDDDGSLRNPSSPTSSTAAVTGINNVGLTRHQRRREMGPLIRTLIGQAANYRRGMNNTATGSTNTTNQRYGGGQQQQFQQPQQRATGPPIFVAFKPIVHAKVPLLKCIHRPTQLEVDLSFALDGAKSSDYLISRLSSQKPQCMAAGRGLIVLLKHLLHEADLNDPSVGGLGSFPLCLMVVWFLESEVHKNFPIELQGSYAVLLTRFFAYYGDTFDGQRYGIDVVGKEMFSKASSNVLILKNPLDRALNAASACTRYFNDVRPLFQRLHKAFMGAMAPRDAGNNNKSGGPTPPPSLIAERLFRKAVMSDAQRRCYGAFAETLKKLAKDTTTSKAPNFTPTFLKSVLAPVTTRWGNEMVCEMEGIGLGTQW